MDINDIQKSETWYCAKCNPPRKEKCGNDNLLRLVTVTDNHERYQKAWYTGQDWDAGKWRISSVKFWKIGAEDK